MVQKFISCGEFRVLGPFKGSWGMLPRKFLKMELLRLAKNAFPAYSYDHEVSWKSLVQLIWTMQEKKGFIDPS